MTYFSLYKNEYQAQQKIYSALKKMQEVNQDIINNIDNPHYNFYNKYYKLRNISNALEPLLSTDYKLAKTYTKLLSCTTFLDRYSSRDSDCLSVLYKTNATLSRYKNTYSDFEPVRNKFVPVIPKALTWQSKYIQDVIEWDYSKL